ncbi:GNAT family N-acetyltransferase [Acutalibacter sp. 1XD8-33]|uniref:GNAT family N-acetyltransferase n=1 Tax=Acutalibacter sp. 1XD8-33 TaxID=2320081 RepID=UPI000EA03EFF|nr:GNAT family N-acetyltransferase [Acutalibacter sp. 1XD8-33]RKJ38412.1 GNAT family N-acetyltransferase [Acutalibacter sp. 1XD8-33]
MYREMKMEDVERVLPLYIDYYNTREECQWTPGTAGKRIRQVLGMDGGYGLLLEDEQGPADFAMGYFKQYDDLVSFILEEIVIERARQGSGLGSALLAEAERRVREQGAAGIELSAVNGQMHEHFYAKAGYGNAKNFVMKVKWF